MKFLKKKYSIETTIGKELLMGLLDAIIIAIFIYLYFEEVNHTMQTIIAKTDVSAFKLTIVFFPLILIITLVFKALNITLMNKK